MVEFPLGLRTRPRLAFLAHRATLSSLWSALRSPGKTFVVVRAASPVGSGCVGSRRKPGSLQPSKTKKSNKRTDKAMVNEMNDAEINTQAHARAHLRTHAHTHTQYAHILRKCASVSSCSHLLQPAPELQGVVRFRVRLHLRRDRRLRNPQAPRGVWLDAGVRAQCARWVPSRFGRWGHHCVQRGPPGPQARVG